MTKLARKDGLVRNALLHFAALDACACAIDTCSNNSIPLTADQSLKRGILSQKEFSAIYRKENVAAGHAHLSNSLTHPGRKRLQ